MRARRQTGASPGVTAASACRKSRAPAAIRQHVGRGPSQHVRVLSLKRRKRRVNLRGAIPRRPSQDDVRWSSVTSWSTFTPSTKAPAQSGSGRRPGCSRAAWRDRRGAGTTIPLILIEMTYINYDIEPQLIF